MLRQLLVELTEGFDRRVGEIDLLSTADQAVVIEHETGPLLNEYVFERRIELSDG